eukprot:jgi/Phyca11/506642/fgenesh2_kg.PHYCAscaffold_21_\
MNVRFFAWSGCDCDYVLKTRRREQVVVGLTGEEEEKTEVRRQGQEEGTKEELSSPSSAIPWALCDCSCEHESALSNSQ